MIRKGLLIFAMLMAFSSCETVNTSVRYTQDLGFAKTVPPIEQYFQDPIVEVLDSDGGEAYIFKFHLNNELPLSDEQILAFVGKAREMGWNDDLKEYITWDSSGQMHKYVFLAHQTFNENDNCLLKISLEDERLALRVSIYYAGAEEEGD